MISDQPARDEDLEPVAAWIASLRPAPPQELLDRGEILARRVVYERSLRHRASVFLGTGTVALVAATVVTLIGR
jgi:hypothetical protein